MNGAGGAVILLSKGDTAWKETLREEPPCGCGDLGCDGGGRGLLGAGEPRGRGLPSTAAA